MVKNAHFKKLTFLCEFQGGGSQNVDFYIGAPSKDAHPIAFQMKWVSGKGGNVPSKISDALQRIKMLSIKHNIPYADLCEYIIASLQK
jgi:hypothetical protein